MVEVEIIKPNITPEENARRLQIAIDYIKSIKYEDLLQTKKA